MPRLLPVEALYVLGGGVGAEQLDGSLYHRPHLQVNMAALRVGKTDLQGRTVLECFAKLQLENYQATGGKTTMNQDIESLLPVVTKLRKV